MFAPNSQPRARVTPAKRGSGYESGSGADEEEQAPAERRVALTWAQRLKRVFNIDIETCRACGGAVRRIAGIEVPVVIERRLTPLDPKAAAVGPGLLPPGRAPPPAVWFD